MSDNINPPRLGSQIYVTLSTREIDDMVYIVQEWIDEDGCECSAWVEMPIKTLQWAAAKATLDLLGDGDDG